GGVSSKVASVHFDRRGLTVAQSFSSPRRAIPSIRKRANVKKIDGPCSEPVKVVDRRALAGREIAAKRRNFLFWAAFLIEPGGGTVLSSPGIPAAAPTSEGLARGS